MEFHSGLDVQLLQEFYMYNNFSTPQTFGKGKRNERIMLMILCPTIAMVVVVAAFVLNAIVFIVLSCILLGFGLCYSLFQLIILYTLRKTAKIAQRNYHPLKYDGWGRLDEKGVATGSNNGNFSFFSAWEECTRALVTPNFYFFCTDQINYVFMKKDVAGREKEMEGYIQTYIQNAGKPVLREKIKP